MEKGSDIARRSFAKVGKYRARRVSTGERALVTFPLTSAPVLHRHFFWARFPPSSTNERQRRGKQGGEREWGFTKPEENWLRCLAAAERAGATSSSSSSRFFARAGSFSSTRPSAAIQLDDTGLGSSTFYLSHFRGYLPFRDEARTLSNVPRRNDPLHQPSAFSPSWLEYLHLMFHAS